MLSSSTHTDSGHFLYSLLHVPISTQIIATITKNSIHNIQYERYKHIELWVGTSLM